uniref:Uncharacterized protein n=1 Tax=Clytia hemisphaerica TaxID=252671 RepID=A0A7M5WLU6_9CNID
MIIKSKNVLRAQRTEPKHQFSAMSKTCGENLSQNEHRLIRRQRNKCYSTNGKWQQLLLLENLTKEERNIINKLFPECMTDEEKEDAGKGEEEVYKTRPVPWLINEVVAQSATRILNRLIFPFYLLF